MEFNLSEKAIVEKLNSLRVNIEDKELFWANRKIKQINENRSFVKSFSNNELNLLIDMPNKVQRDKFLKKYISSVSKNTLRMIVLNVDIENIENIKDIKDIYVAILKNMGMPKGNISIKNLEELEYFVISQIQKFKSEIVIINYSGDTLIPSKKINTILYHLYALSEMCKVTFNLVGSISPTVYFNSNRKIPIGNFFYFDGENNSQDVSYLKQLKSS